MTDMQSRLSELDRIIGDAEALKYGKRELNERIFCFVENMERAEVSSTDSPGLSSQEAWVSRPPFHPEVVPQGPWMASRPRIKFGSAPAYSYDLADARTLLGVGMLFRVEGPGSPHQQRASGKAEVWYDDGYAHQQWEKNLRIAVTAPTPELALCIAALKAKQMTLQSFLADAA